MLFALVIEIEKMYQLETPKYLYLLAIVVILVVLFLFQLIWKRKKQREFATDNLLKHLAPNTSFFKSILKFVVLSLALIAIIIALVNPKIGTKMETVKRQGIDIVFAVDVSKSMSAEDVAPNRLEKTKQLVSQIINTLGNDRIGIVGYAGSAYPVLPMTTDYSIAKMYLQNMNTDMVSSQGTALNDAIRLASQSFDADDTSKLIILVSDGEDHGEGADEASKIAEELGIKIITIGVGTPNGGTIPMKGINGQIIEYKKNKDGETVITKLNQETLENIANEANGGYIAGTSTKEVVEKIKNALDNIEKTEFETQQVAEYQTQYQWFLGIAFVLLLLDVFFLERKTAWLQKLNLFNEK